MAEFNVSLAGSSSSSHAEGSVIQRTEHHTHEATICPPANHGEGLMLEFDQLRVACLTPLPNPLSLLSLPEHVLSQIGHYISEDNHIPYPACGPSWQSLTPPRSSLRPLRDYRAICHRIRQVVPLSGTWLVVKSMADLQKYAWMSDDELVRSVS
jgi:hypothetical protein